MESGPLASQYPTHGVDFAMRPPYLEGEANWRSSFGWVEGRTAESNAIENEVAQKHGKSVEHGEQNIMRRKTKAKTSAEKEPIAS